MLCGSRPSIRASRKAAVRIANGPSDPLNRFAGATIGSALPRVFSSGMSSNGVRMMAVLAGLRTGEDTSSLGHGAAIYTPVWQHDGMSSTLGAAVVGTGFGVITHARALDAAGIEVRALIGRDPDKTAKRAALFGIEHATTDRAEAFARDDVDVVAVTTPPYSHAEIVLDAVAAGKHVMCEKPFARDLAQAREMLHAADEAGVVHLLGTEFRFGTGQALLTRTVRSGQIGAPRYALFVLHLPTLCDPSAELP